MMRVFPFSLFALVYGHVCSGDTPSFGNIVNRFRKLHSCRLVGSFLLVITKPMNGLLDPIFGSVNS